MLTYCNENADSARPYEKCMALPNAMPRGRPEARGIPYQPCKEGGSIVAFRYLEGFQANLMVFYTPSDATGLPPLTTAASSSALNGQFGTLFEQALQSCGPHLQELPVFIVPYAHCFQMYMLQFFASQFTPVRGIAFIPDVPAAGLYSPPGLSSFGGYVSLKKVDLDLSTATYASFPELLIMRVWLVLNVPIEIP